MDCLETRGCCRRAEICKAIVIACCCTLLKFSSCLSLFLPMLSPRFSGVGWTAREQSEVQSAIAMAEAHQPTKHD